MRTTALSRDTSQNRASQLRVGLILVLLPGPVTAQHGWAKKAPPKKVTLAWPLPPEKPRIKYTTSIYGTADVEPREKANFLDRLAEIEKKDFKPTFLKPYGVATDSHNRIYVSDSSTRCFHLE